MSIPEDYLSPIGWRSLQSETAGLAGFIDVETTGLSPYSEEIVELAIVLFAFDRERSTILGTVDEYVGLREPRKLIPSGAMRVHGITDDDVRGQRLDPARIEELIEKSEFLVAHNAGFDKGFVARLFPMAAKKPWMCSMRDVDWYGKGHRSRGLQPLLRAHGIQVAEAHRGEADVKATLALLTRHDRAGNPYFGELYQKYVARYGDSEERSLA